MANPIMGEVAFEVAGQRYVFALNTYARAILQKRSGLTFAQFFTRGETAWGDAELIDLYHAGLYQRHQLSDQEIGALLDELGAERAGKIVADAITLIIPKGAEAGKPNGNPTAAGQTIGTVTTLSSNG